jgi:hypothetical protein
MTATASGVARCESRSLTAMNAPLSDIVHACSVNVGFLQHKPPNDHAPNARTNKLHARGVRRFAKPTQQGEVSGQRADAQTNLSILSRVHRLT